MQDSQDSIVIFCDGACSGNPGPGGWGIIIVAPQGQVLERGGFAPQTTNNQMELTAAIEALKKIASLPEEVFLYTDSTYVIRGITQWIWSWEKKGWKTGEGNDVSNIPLWKELAALVKQREGKVSWKYVRGHCGTPGNERVDEIAVSFSKKENPELYCGPLKNYPFDLNQLPSNTELPNSSFEKKKEKKAYSYLSLVNHTPTRHHTWPECEQRVKGRSGAKFKKAMSPKEEIEILKSWGFKIKDLK